jgi:hypothetical protein
MPDAIFESGMAFISENTYHIEQSQAYRCLGKNIRSVEFIRRKDTELLFVEAKTTFPNPENIEKPERFREEVGIICEKFIHSLNLFSSIKTGVNQDVLSEAFILPGKQSVVFVLVVRDHKIEWCNRIQEKIIQELPIYLKKLWRPQVRVCNSDFAKKMGLVNREIV